MSQVFWIIVTGSIVVLKLGRERQDILITPVILDFESDTPGRRGIGDVPVAFVVLI